MPVIAHLAFRLLNRIALRHLAFRLSDHL